MSTNNFVPSYYISGIQYARLYALGYLDEKLRSADKGEKNSYELYMSSALELAKKIKAEDVRQSLENIIGKVEVEKLLAIPNIDWFFDRYYKNLQRLIPDQPFMDAFEINPFWASTNSIVYNIAIHDYLKESNVALLTECLGDNEAQWKHSLILNMLFVKSVKIDPPPSVMDGYSISTLENVVKHNETTAITLPSNATCC